MRLRRLASGSPIRLASELGRGGEGRVFAVQGNAHLVAKIYLQAPSSLKAEKLRAMTRGATSTMLKLAAWPMDVLVDEHGQVRGFLMRRISKRQDLHELYSPKSRAEAFPYADFRFVVRVATNLARVFAYIHSQGHVIGDVNHGNAVVASDATVILIDCDSFQARDRIKTYFCDVGVPLFTPPELQGRSFRGLRRSPNHDAFGLAVLLFHLLFQGRHPFAGRYQHGELTIERAIAEHRFAYGSSSERTGMLAPPGTLPLDTFGPHIAQLFERAFEMNAAHGERPTALEWIGALESLDAELVQCESTPAHVHPGPPGICCWCAVEARAGITLFGKRLATVGGDVAAQAEALWQAIVKVAHPGPLPASPAEALARDSQAAIARAKQLFRRTGRPAAVVGAFVSLLLLKQSEALGFFCLLASTAIALITFETAERRAQRRAILDRASQNWTALIARWHRECSSRAFDELLAKLYDAKLELTRLAAARRQELEQLSNFHARLSRWKFLEGFRISEISSRHLTHRERAKLLASGIATAADVDRNQLDVSNLLGRSASEMLLAWYRMHLRSYDGPVGAPAASEIAAVEVRFDHLEGRLLKQLREGAAELQQKRAQILALRVRLEDPIQAAHDAVSRAQLEQ